MCPYINTKESALFRVRPLVQQNVHSGHGYTAVEGVLLQELDRECTRKERSGASSLFALPQSHNPEVAILMASGCFSGWGALLVCSSGHPDSQRSILGMLQLKDWSKAGTFTCWSFPLDWPHGGPRLLATCAHVDSLWQGAWGCHGAGPNQAL